MKGRMEMTIAGVLVLLCASSPRPAAGSAPPVDSLASPVLAALVEAPPQAGTAPETRAPEWPLSWSAGGTMASRYVFQGFDYSDGRPVWQPSGSAGWRGFSLLFWGNMSVDRSELNEIDLSFQHAWEAEAGSAAIGYMHLRYPHRTGWSPTQEIYVDLTAAAPGAPTLSAHVDFDAGAGAYFTGSVEATVSRGAASLTLTPKLFWQEHYYGMTGIPAMELNISGGYSRWGIEWTPSVSRFVTWENRSFRGEGALARLWLVSLTLAPAESD